MKWLVPRLHRSVRRIRIPSSHHAGQLACLALAGLSLAAMIGCGPKRLRTDFTGYESTYAETSNRELLLNLARLENREPTYFFKIGTIQSTYKMAASLPTTASLAIQGTVPGGTTPVGGGSPAVSYENDPIFTFIPVNDETNAQFLLQQVPPETFYILYEQGWRIDQLFRLMVDRIELTVTTNNKTCEVVTYRNLPPPVYTTSNGSQAEKDALYKNYQDALTQYVTFLRISAILYSLQKHGDLILSGTNTFVPFDARSAISDRDPAVSPSAPVAGAPAATPAANSPAPSSSDSGSSKTSRAPTATDMVNAWSKSAVWEDSPNGWILGEKTFKPVFYLNHYTTTTTACGVIPAGTSATPGPDVGKIDCDIANDEDLANLRDRDSLLAVILDTLKNGFSISDSSNSQNAAIGPCPAGNDASHAPTSHLVMRSLLGLMAAASEEQQPFQALLENNPTIPLGPEVDQTAPQASATASRPQFGDAVPQIEKLPLLSLLGGNKSEDVAPLIAVEYHGKRYEIADSKDNEANENRYWDRDVFRLIDQLTSQVTVDISKFPLTTILQ